MDCLADSIVATRMNGHDDIFFGKNSIFANVKRLYEQIEIDSSAIGICPVVE